MRGTITTRQQCPICGSKFIHAELRRALICPNHPEQRASKFVVRFPPSIYLNFSSYEEASRQLTVIRYENDKGKFDKRDYQRDKPLGFTTLSNQYLERKSGLKSIRKTRLHIRKAQERFGQRNIKDINGGDIEDYLFSIQGIGEKTRDGYKSTLHDFWQFLLRRGVINLAQMPTFPKIEYELAYRKYTDWDTQGAIIDKVHELCDHINPKVALGIEMLATYTALRPDDLRRVSEADIDLKHSIMNIRYPTKRKNRIKTIRLVPEHVAVIEELQDRFPGIGDAPFFRHHSTGRGNKEAGEVFGPSYLRKEWKKACRALDIHGLDLYGGTRHTTTTELSRNYSTDLARKASGHVTNQAFDRYCQVQDSTALDAAKIVMGRRGQVVEFPAKKKSV